MNQATAVDLIRHALMTAFWISIPILLIGFVAGALVSLFQILTSMQDAAVSTVPRLAAFLAGMMVLLPWMLMKMLGYTTLLFSDFSRYAR